MHSILRRTTLTIFTSILLTCIQPILSASAEESGIECMWDDSTVTCDVVTDTVRIESITLNRDNCESPVTLQGINFWIKQGKSPADNKALRLEERRAYEKINDENINEVAKNGAKLIENSDIIQSMLDVYNRGASDEVASAILLSYLVAQASIYDAQDRGAFDESASMVVWLRNLTNPLKNTDLFSFGDKIAFSHVCPNLLEVTIGINGEQWTWKE